MVQIFVKVDGSQTFPLMISPCHKVDDVMRRILNSLKSSKNDVYTTCEGRVLRWSDELRSSGVGNGFTVPIMNMTRGGGNHRNKKKQSWEETSRESKEPRISARSTGARRVSSVVNAEDAVIGHCEVTEGSRMSIVDWAEGNNIDMEQWIQIYTELTGLHVQEWSEHVENIDRGIRRAVDAKRRNSKSEAQHRRKARMCVSQKRKRRRKKRAQKSGDNR